MVLSTDPRYSSMGTSPSAAATSSVIKVTSESVQNLIQQSLQMPVLMVGVAAQLQDHQAVVSKVQRVAARFAGKALVAEFDAQAQPMLAQQLGVLQTPVIKLIFQVQVLADIPGAEQETKLVALLERILGPATPEAPVQDSAEARVTLIEALRQRGEQQQAQTELDAALLVFPKSQSLQMLRGHLLLDQGEVAAAEAVCKALTDKDSLAAQLFARLWWLQQWLNYTQSTDPAALPKMVMDEITLQYVDALRLGLQREYQAAYAVLLSLFQQHSAWQEGLAKQALMQLMALVGTDQPLAKQWRRQVFSLFH